MLKTPDIGTIRLVTQPDHAAVSGYMAAHWGNEEFSKLGYFDNSSEPEQLAAETIFGIAEHDNGWWEWEASPPVSASDKLPKGLTEVLSIPEQGAQRWRIGIRRFEESHPYASLLINFQAYWLYRAQQGEVDEKFLHPLFRGKPYVINEESRPVVSSLIETLNQQQKDLKQRLEKLEGWQKDAIQPSNLQPHVKMLQTLDAISLSLCSDLLPPLSGETKGLGRDEVEFLDIPRRNWDDRVTLQFHPLGEGRIECNPYPFDEDNLVVPVVVTDLKDDTPNEVHQIKEYRVPKKIVTFTFQRPK